jgi:hypothetical protein
LIVSKNHTGAVGVTLQEGVLGHGSVLFSCLYLFMDVSGKKTMKFEGEPMARHSIEFLENLVYYARHAAGGALSTDTPVPEAKEQE